jgi:3-oxoacyl-[acyl-carrier protein] reductase
MFDISTRSAIVTGGTKGIGKGIARCLARAGVHVLISGRDETSAKACAEELTALGGGKVSYLLGNVADPGHCRALVETAVTRHGGLDIVCANAGIFPDVKLKDMKPEDIDKVLDTNVKGTMLTVQAAIEELTKSGRGRVILTSSITGPITGYPGGL